MKRLFTVLFFPVLACAAHLAHADEWPTKPVHAIVPVAAGSSTDIVPRLVLEQVAAQLGQPIVVENRSGAAGTIGSALVARAQPDGYTLLAHGSAHTIAPAMHAKLSYDPVGDFAAVAALGISPGVLVVSPSKGYRTVADLIAAAKAHPGKLNYSSVGIGSATHLSAERFRASADIVAVHVPSKGGAEAMLEAITGRVDFFFGPVALVLPQIREGKLLALAVNTSKRSAVLPDVPTLGESGVANAEYPVWFGLFAPAGTPRNVVEKLNRETVRALQSPKVNDRLLSLGVEPMIMSTGEFDAHVRREVALNGALVAAAGIKPQ